MTLQAFDGRGVHAVWSIALSRRTTDPEGAITIARTVSVHAIQINRKDHNVPITPGFYTIRLDILLDKPTMWILPNGDSRLGAIAGA